MVQNYNFSEKIKLALSLAVIAILFLGVYFLGYGYFFKEKTKTYVIENKFYGFKVNVPEKWIAEENTSYPESVIAQILEDCRNDQSLVRQIGAFRFKDNKHNYDFAAPGNSVFPTGAILEVTISCFPDADGGSYGNDDLIIGGEKAGAGLLTLANFEEAKYFSFFHNGFNFKATELIYVSPDDTGSEGEIKEDYARTFQKILAGFSFIK